MVYLVHSELSDEELDKRKYVFPEERKFPLPDKAHVLSAIKFFNYVEPSKEKILASAILKRMREYGITEVNVGPKNRFSKYYHSKEGKKMGNYYLAHSAKGQTWKNHKYIGIKNGRYIYPVPGLNYAQSRIENGAQRVIEQERKRRRDPEYQKRKSEQNQQESRGLYRENKQRRDLEKLSTLHDQRRVESGNVVNGRDGSDKIYRRSDVNLVAVKAYSVANGFKKTVQKYGEKGKAFLLALFKKK